jgi:hypothetical protein
MNAIRINDHFLEVVRWILMNCIKKIGIINNIIPVDLDVYYDKNDFKFLFRTTEQNGFSQIVLTIACAQY